MEQQVLRADRQEAQATRAIHKYRRQMLMVQTFVLVPLCVALVVASRDRALAPTTGTMTISIRKHCIPFQTFF